MSQAREYCRQNNIPFKLILDKPPGHPQHICDMYPDVKVAYLPLNMATLQMLTIIATWEEVTHQWHLEESFEYIT